MQLSVAFGAIILSFKLYDIVRQQLSSRIGTRPNEPVTLVRWYSAKNHLNLAHVVFGILVSSLPVFSTIWAFQPLALPMYQACVSMPNHTADYDVFVDKNQTTVDNTTNLLNVTTTLSLNATNTTTSTKVRPHVPTITAAVDSPSGCGDEGLTIDFKAIVLGAGVVPALCLIHATLIYCQCYILRHKTEQLVEAYANLYQLGGSNGDFRHPRTAEWSARIANSVFVPIDLYKEFLAWMQMNGMVDITTPRARSQRQRSPRRRRRRYGSSASPTPAAARAQTEIGSGDISNEDPNSQESDSSSSSSSDGSTSSDEDVSQGGIAGVRQDAEIELQEIRPIPASPAPPT